jgi:hypothetical protein
MTVGVGLLPVSAQTPDTLPVLWASEGRYTLCLERNSCLGFPQPPPADESILSHYRRIKGCIHRLRGDKLATAGGQIDTPNVLIWKPGASLSNYGSCGAAGGNSRQSGAYRLCILNADQWPASRPGSFILSGGPYNLPAHSAGNRTRPNQTVPTQHSPQERYI